MPGKPLPKLIKTRPCAVEFTLCLPGSPKVHAGGACGAWLPGRELLRISAFRDRIEGTGGLFSFHPARHDRDVTWTGLAIFARTTLMSLCNEWWRTSRPVAEIAEAPN